MNEPAPLDYIIIETGVHSATSPIALGFRRLSAARQLVQVPNLVFRFPQLPGSDWTPRRTPHFLGTVIM